jgi:hypothetical protein
MRRTDLTDATMQAWARLNEPQRQRFFEMFLNATLRLDALALRAWLRRRAPKSTARRSDRSDPLHNFGCRYGRLAE